MSKAFRIYPSKKLAAAGGLAAMSLGEIIGPTAKRISKHKCKRMHRWLGNKWNRHCTQCGLEETKDPVTLMWVPNAKAEK